MDWKTIHGYAEEAELWTTLGINLWVILTAIVFAFGYMRRSASTVEKQVVFSAGIAAYLLWMLLAFLLLIVTLFETHFGMSWRDIGEWVGFVVCINLVFWVFKRPST